MRAHKPVGTPKKKFATAVSLIVASMVWIAPTQAQAEVNCPCFKENEIEANCD